jgi:hypothetical protein
VTSRHTTSILQKQESGIRDQGFRKQTFTDLGLVVNDTTTNNIWLYYFVM